MSRAARLAVALSAALAAGPVRAQWETRPIVLRLEGSGRDVLPGTSAGAVAGADDLLVLDQAGRTASLRPHHAPLTVRPSSFPIASSPLQRAFRAGYLAPNAADALVDVASHFATGGLGTPPSRIEVVFGHDPAAVHAFTLPLPTWQYGPADGGGPPYVPSFLRLLARAPASDTLVMPYCLEASCARLFLVDPATVSSAAVRTLPAPILEPMFSQQGEAFPVSLSAVARLNDLDDVAVSSFGTVVLWSHNAAATALSGLDLSDPVVVGTSAHPFLPADQQPSWLPATLRGRTRSGFNEVHGVASADVDLDGIPDLVFAMVDPLSPIPGALVWVKGTGSLAEFANPNPGHATWQDLGAALGLPDPAVVRPLRGRPGGAAAFAVWDRTLQELHVVTPLPAEGRLAIWSAPAPGTWARDLRLADVVGGAAPDLVAIMDDGAGPTTALVFPDPAGPWPTLSWAAGSPGVAIRGVPHALAVVLDPGGATSVEVDWLTGPAAGAPAGTGLSHVLAATCAPSPPPLAVTVRAISETGTLSPDLVATVSWASAVPTLAVSGAPGGRLVLPPGGTSASFDAFLGSSCGVASFGGTAWPGAATIADSAGPARLRRTVALPEAAYPELLAGPAPVVSVATTDPVVAPSTVAVAVALDASGLVEVREEADRTALAPGDLAVLRIRVRSRLGVPLPLVHLVGVLAGLEPAGRPTVIGAELVATGRGGAELVLSALPPAGAEVRVELPVRAVAARSGAAAEAWSSGGWALTAPGAATTLEAPAAGCGCGAGSAPGTAALALLALALRRRRAT